MGNPSCWCLAGYRRRRMGERAGERGSKMRRTETYTTYIKQIFCYTVEADMWCLSATIQREKEEDIQPWANKVKWKKPRTKKVVSWYPLLQGCGEHFSVSMLPHKNPEQARSCLQQHLRGTQWCPLPSPWTLRPRRSASLSSPQGELKWPIPVIASLKLTKLCRIVLSRLIGLEPTSRLPGAGVGGGGTSALLLTAHHATHHRQSHLIIT